MTFVFFRLVCDFNDTFKYIFMIYFIWAGVTICDTLLMMQNELVEFFEHFFCSTFY